MVYILIRNVNVRNKLLLLLDNFSLKVLELKKIPKNFKGTQTTSKKSLEPAINATAPDIGMALAAESNNPAVGQATTNRLKSTGGRKVLPLTDMHGNGLKLRVM